MNINALVELIETQLQPQLVKDYCPNGLQVEGCAEVSKIVTGVTASMALIDEAIEQQAQAILVHHGYFWKSEAPEVVGMKKRRLQKLLAHDINLIAYHLPLDVHPTLGNNAQLGRLLGLQNIQVLASAQPSGIVMTGELDQAVTLDEFARVSSVALNRKPLVIDAGGHQVKRIAWCTGGGQGYIDLAAQANLDAFISGEISEQTTHSAIEQGVHYLACGHHATERYGVKALGEFIAKHSDIGVTFVDLHNPA